MTTDWAGSSMQMPPISEPSGRTVGAFAEMLAGMSAKEASAPDKVADIVVRLTAIDEPPLRFLIGLDAVQ